MTAVILDSAANKIPNPEKLRGFRLQGDEEPVYMLIKNDCSEVLQLQLVVEDKIIAFYQLDNSVRLLPLEKLRLALEQQIEQTAAETQRADRAIQKTQELEAQIALYQQRLGELPIDRTTLLE
jgi:hypothetical protein